MRSSTRFAPLVSQCSSTCVGALHRTGVGGPVNETMRGPVAPGLVLAVLVAELVDPAAARLEELLLHALRMTTPAIVASRVRRIPRS